MTPRLAQDRLGATSVLPQPSCFPSGQFCLLCFVLTMYENMCASLWALSSWRVGPVSGFSLCLGLTQHRAVAGLSS